MPIALPPSPTGLQYLVAFNNGPLDDPALITTTAAAGIAGAPGRDTAPTVGGVNVWTDISQYVTGHTWNRGRQHELDRFETGLATISLKNSSAVFNPWNTSGPFYGLLKPMRILQIRWVYLGVTYTRWTGQITAYPIKWDVEIDSDAELVCSDAFRTFALADITSTQYSDQVLARTPSAYYRLGELGTVAKDSSGNGRNGSYTGTITQGVPGALIADVDAACSLNRSGPISLPSGTFPNGAGAYSYMFWINFGGVTPTVNDTIIDSEGVATGSGSYMGCYVSAVSGGVVTLLCDLADAVPHVALVSPPSFPVDSSWHHVAFVYDGAGNSTGYHNAVAAPVNTTSAPNRSAITYFHVGTDLYGRTLNASLDELQLYNGVALTAAQVLADYNAGVGQWANQDTGTRIGKVLDTIGWSAGARNIDTGNSMAQAVTTNLTQTKSLAYMQLVEQTEDGGLFMTGDGKVRFISRHSLITGSHLVSQITLGDAGTPTNLISTESASFEGGTTGAWQSSPTGYTAVTLANTATFAQDGTKAVLLTWPTASALACATALNITGLVVGKQYAFSVYVRVPAGSVGVTLSEGYGTWLTAPCSGYPAASTVTNAFQRLAVTFTATATSGYMVLGNTTGSTSGQTCVFDAAQLVAGIAPRDFTTAAPEMPFNAGPDLALDDQDIWNEAAVTREGGVVQVASDAASQADYGRRTQSQDGLLYQTDTESLDRAYWNIDHFAQPQTRLRSVSMRLTGQTTNLPAILALELLDRVTVNRHYMPGGGDAFTQVALVEHMTETTDAETGDTILTWALSPSDAQTYWLLGDPVYGVLGSTTKLAF